MEKTEAYVILAWLSLFLPIVALLSLFALVLGFSQSIVGPALFCLPIIAILLGIISLFMRMGKPKEVRSGAALAVSIFGIAISLTLIYSVLTIVSLFQPR